jgi:hypothetical protein
MFSLGSSRFFESGGCLLISATASHVEMGRGGMCEACSISGRSGSLLSAGSRADQVGFSLLAHLRRVERPPHESLLPIRI